ncbi:coatomer subunit epsilon, partial [Phenoliferia sp. Uapishka_3]
LGILSHLYLSLSLPSLSNTLIHSPGTTSWTADSLLSQILSARTNLALGPTAKYQESYYVYEEVKGMQGGRGEATLAGVSVSQALLGRWEESNQATEEALEVNPTHPTSLANSIALALHCAKPPAVTAANLAFVLIPSPFDKLQEADPNHPMLLDLAAKESAFDEAASKFFVSVSA